MAARFKPIHEVVCDWHHPRHWRLYFQWGRYNYDNGDDPQMGYRFIWKRPNGRLAPTRGQARIPSAKELFHLIQKATEAGWFITVEATRDDGEK